MMANTITQLNRGTKSFDLIGTLRNSQLSGQIQVDTYYFLKFCPMEFANENLFLTLQTSIK